MTEQNPRNVPHQAYRHGESVLDIEWESVEMLTEHELDEMYPVEDIAYLTVYPDRYARLSCLETTFIIWNMMHDKTVPR